MLMRPALLLASLVLIAGCDRSAPDKVPTRPEAVLEGSVSDAMLQTDQLQVEAPLAEPSATGLPEGEGESEDASPKARRSPRAAGGPAAPASRQPPTGAATPEPQAAASPR